MSREARSRTAKPRETNVVSRCRRPFTAPEVRLPSLQRMLPLKRGRRTPTDCCISQKYFDTAL